MINFYGISTLQIWTPSQILLRPTILESTVSKLYKDSLKSSQVFFRLVTNLNSLLFLEDRLKKQVHASMQGVLMMREMLQILWKLNRSWK
jgi:hypothetical protein